MRRGRSAEKFIIYIIYNIYTTTTTTYYYYYYYYVTTTTTTPFWGFAGGVGMLDFKEC